uniref:UBA domain-containing protein n=1 Tax=Caenorhabditis tropicalis TaxID=1561998 RepID=A0A1I7U6V5_9PELO
MSFNDVFHDYISDIPMDMSRKFYPTRNIKVDLIHIPDHLTFSKFELQYSFDAESRAREQFDKQNETITLDTTTTSTTASSGGTSAEAKTSESKGGVHDVLSQNVLVPCPVNSAPSVTSSTQPVTPSGPSVTFHEFESINNVFDDMQILALDDRKALQEVLMLTTSSASQPSSSLNQSSNNNNHIKPQSEKPDKIGKSQQEELRKRLLTKGYRQDIVEKSMNLLPKSRLVHIEYYMKACRTIEKTGRSTVDETLPFLIQCDLMDKNLILTYSDVCANLLKMGFPRHQTFEAVAVEKGNQNRALSRLLPS